MYLKLQVSLWTCILYILYCQSEVTDIQQKNIGTYINNLCHIQDGCDGSIESMADAEKYIGNTCCKGCPCENGCSVEQNLDQFTEFTECLKPVPFPYDEEDARIKQFDYKFVVKEPIEGCQSQKDDILPSCSLDIVTDLGNNFYPVYSYDKNVNFKNQNCALCHGAKQIVHWDVYSYYRGQKSHELETITLTYKQLNSTDIRILFVAPNSESRDFMKICFDIIDHCKAENKDRMLIPDSVNMTKDQVKRACEHGPHFLFMKGFSTWFKNLFCAFCNSAPFNKNNLGYCENNFFGSGIKTITKSFTFLLRRDYIQTETPAKPDKEKKFACSKERTLMKQDTCREVICPVLQIRQRDGGCGYPFDTFRIDKIVLMLSLSGHRKLSPDFFTNMTSGDVKLMFEKRSPWPSPWEILFVQIRNDITDEIDFFVHIGLTASGPTDVEALHKNLIGSLSRSWVLDIDDKDSMFLSQNFFIHGPVIKDTFADSDKLIVIPLWTSRSKNISFLTKAEKPSWTELFTNLDAFYRGTKRENVEIKKSFLCDQVQLYPKEYIYERDGLPLFLRKEGRFLYPNEYYVYKNVVAICLEDSRFKLYEYANVANTTLKERCYICKLSFLLLVGLFVNYL